MELPLRTHAIFTRPRLVALVCLFNTLLALCLIAFLFNQPHEAKPFAPSESTKAPAELSDHDLWLRAKSATNFREAVHYLKRIKNPDLLNSQLNETLTEAKAEGELDYAQWTFFSAAIQSYGELAELIPQLSRLEPWILSTRQPLTIRDTAFRSYITNFVRLHNDSSSPAQVFEIIDHIDGEANELSAASLQAEQYLLNNQIERSTQDEPFDQRLYTVLTDPRSIQPRKQAALQIYSARNGLEGLPLQQIFSQSDLATQTDILSLIEKQSAAVETHGWIQTLSPATRKQEAILARLRQ